MSDFASHEVPVTPTGPDAPEAQPKENVQTSNPPEVNTQERPEWLPEKFKSPEELAKAYSELESKLGQQKPNETSAPATAQNPENKQEKTNEEKPENKQDDPNPSTELPEHFEKFSQEFSEKGELSPESYKELQEKHGLSKEYVDLYIEGVKARQTAYFNAIYSETGGEEGFTKLSEWANENLSKEELAAVDAALASGNAATASLAVRGLMVKFREASGVEPKLLGGDAPEPGVKPFASVAEVTAAMSDPRYAKDPAYRAEVEKRLAVSDVI